MRKCNRCHKRKSLSDFHKNHWQCKECRSITEKERPRRTPEQYAQDRARQNRRRKENPEKNRAQARAWNREHRQLARDRSKQWAEENQDRKRTLWEKAEATRRARKKAQFVEDIDRDVVFEMHGGRCGICKDQGPIIGKFHVDHIIPLSKGSLHSYVNVQPAHPDCNQRKSATIMDEPVQVS